MQTEQKPPTWCFKVSVKDTNGEHIVYRTGALFQRDMHAMRAAMLWTVNFCARYCFPPGAIVEPQVFRRRR